MAERFRIEFLDRELYRKEIDNLDLGMLAGARDGDAGLDLRATADFLVAAGEFAVIPLGVAIALPHDYVGWMTGRSSITRSRGAFSTEGKIDAGYRGEVHHFVHAGSRQLRIGRGDRICQLIVLPIVMPALWERAEGLANEQTERGTGGFGSSGIA